jgi:hypothetical protein
VGKNQTKNGPAKGEGGAPRKEFDLDVAKRAASIGCTVDEIAALIGLPKRTFYDHMKRDPAIQTAIDEAREQGRGTLRRLQWQRANGGSDTMLIWLGKQMLKQRDKVAHTGGDDDDPPVAIRHLFRWQNDPEPKKE